MIIDKLIISYLNLCFIGYNFSGNRLSTSTETFDFYHKFIESVKFGYAQRSLLGDPDFIPVEDVSQPIFLNT